MGTRTYPTSSPPFQFQSPLLPHHQHHHDRNADDVAVSPTTAATNPPPRPPFSVSDDTQPTSVDQDNKDDPGGKGQTLVGVILMLLIVVPTGLFLGFLLSSFEVLKAYSPRADVVSAFVSVSNSTNNSSNGPTATAGRLLTANWAIVIHLDNDVSCCQSVHLYRVDASVFHGDDDAAQRPLASTQRFTGFNGPDKRRQDHVTFSVQLGAKEADVGERVVSAISRDYWTESAGQSRLRFKAVITVWVRLKPNRFRSRFYLARISCDPLWIGSSGIVVGTISKDNRECHVHVIRESKPVWLDNGWVVGSLICATIIVSVSLCIVGAKVGVF
ncbi:unnamed protein product [Linum trigynum]|uniref:Uncharacterized protein n=1 Tax=Linum trigynum TaxID=586398 RepID=A0AAV2F2H2_9ROSI